MKRIIETLTLHLRSGPHLELSMMTDTLLHITWHPGTTLLLLMNMLTLTTALPLHIDHTQMSTGAGLMMIRTLTDTTLTKYHLTMRNPLLEDITTILHPLNTVEPLHQLNMVEPLHPLITVEPLHLLSTEPHPLRQACLILTL